MSNFIPFETPGGVVWVQVEDSVNGSVLVTSFQNSAFASFEDVAAALTSNAQLLRDMLADLQPSGIEITFGIKAGLNPGVTPGSGTRVFALANGDENANYRVKVTWEEEQNES